MSTHTCTSCGTTFDRSRDDCPLCGEVVPEEVANEATDVGQPTATGEAGAAAMHRRETETVAESEGSDFLYRLTIGLAVGYAILGMGSLLTRNQSLFFGAAVLLFASVATMYLDLRALDERLYGTRPILWAVGALLLYFVVLPIYVYKRHQVG